MQINNLPHSWHDIFHQEFSQPYFQKLISFIKQEQSKHTIFPPTQDWFNAFKYCCLNDLKVVIIGQDPYHDHGQAHGLCFSVQDGVPFPPSLRNIFQEIKDDIGTDIPKSGNLTRWAEQGVLLLNTTLTVRAHQAASHKDQGWEIFTDNIIRYIASQKQQLVFLLWGSHAQKKQELIDKTKYHILKSPHPSPLSAYRGFLGNKHFSKTNEYLQSVGKEIVDW